MSQTSGIPNITQEELVAQLKLIAEQMIHENPDKGYEGLLALRDLLQREDLWYNLVSLSEYLTPRTLTLVYLLRQFVISDLWKNFGQQDNGFPRVEGEPLIDQICQDLGRFIPWFLKEGELALGYFTFAMVRYYELLRITKQAHEVGDSTIEWIRLGNLTGV